MYRVWWTGVRFKWVFARKVIWRDQSDANDVECHLFWFCYCNWLVTTFFYSQIVVFMTCVVVGALKTWSSISFVTCAPLLPSSPLIWFKRGDNFQLHISSLPPQYIDWRPIRRGTLSNKPQHFFCLCILSCKDLDGQLKINTYNTTSVFIMTAL